MAEGAFEFVAAEAVPLLLLLQIEGDNQQPLLVLVAGTDLDLLYNIVTQQS